MVRSFRSYNVSFFFSVLGAVYDVVCECWCGVVNVGGWGQGRKEVMGSFASDLLGAERVTV